MAMRTQYLPLGPQFGPFLFSSIGEEENGMQLTVISALARFGLDPWEEAARLAALPKTAAREALVALIARFPEERWRMSDRASIANRLIGLLPAAAPPIDARAAERHGKTPRRHAAMWLLWVLLAGSVLVGAYHKTFVPDAPASSETRAHE
jgi:hypothetical protein